MTMVEDAVNQMVANLRERPMWNNLGVRGSRNLRLWLDVDDATEPWGAIGNYMITELTELVTLGDREHPTDPWLRAFDGEVKSGKTLTAFAITSALLETDSTPLYTTMEDGSVIEVPNTKYTIDFRVQVAFDGEDLPPESLVASKEAFIKQ